MPAPVARAVDRCSAPGRRGCRWNGSNRTRRSDRRVEPARPRERRQSDGPVSQPARRAAPHLWRPRERRGQRRGAGPRGPPGPRGARGGGGGMGPSLWGRGPAARAELAVRQAARRRGSRPSVGAPPWVTWAPHRRGAHVQNSRARPPGPATRERPHVPRAHRPSACPKQFLVFRSGQLLCFYSYPYGPYM